MNSFYDDVKIEIENDKKLAKQLMLQPMKGNTFHYYSLLDVFYCKGISKNKV